MKYKVAVAFSVCNEVEIEADSFDEAISIAEDSDFGLPLEGAEYIDGSFEVDREVSAYLNGIKE